MTADLKGTLADLKKGFVSLKTPGDPESMFSDVVEYQPDETVKDEGMCSRLTNGSDPQGHFFFLVRSQESQKR